MTVLLMSFLLAGSLFYHIDRACLWLTLTEYVPDEMLSQETLKKSLSSVYRKLCNADFCALVYSMGMQTPHKLKFTDHWTIRKPSLYKKCEVFTNPCSPV